MQTNYTGTFILIGLLAVAGVALSVVNMMSQQKFQQEMRKLVTDMQDEVQVQGVDNSTPGASQGVQLSQVTAQQLVAAIWQIELYPVEGPSATVTITENTNDSFNVVALVPAFDDSVASTKFEGTASFVNNTWTLSNPPVKTWACHAGRGHQNYSTVNCL